MINTLFVGKTSQTFADALLVYGLALVTNDVLRRIDDTGDVTVTLRDAGPYYTLDLSPELDPERLPAVGVYLPPAPVIRTAKNAKQLPQDLPLQALVDYEAQRDRRTAYFAARQNLSKEAQVAMRAGGEHPELEFLRSLLSRGLRGVRLVTSDAHEGLKAALAQALSGATWQRCRVHFMRNVLAHVTQADKSLVAAALRTIFA